MIPNFKSAVSCFTLLFVCSLILIISLSADDAKSENKTTEVKTAKAALAKPEKDNAEKCLNCGNFPNSKAKTEKEMKAYKLTIPQTKVQFEMVPIPGGQFVMGSPNSEAKRNKDEGPQHKVNIEPFWMGKFEVTFDEYDIWTGDLDLVARKKIAGTLPTPCDAVADAITRPTPSYVPMDKGMGRTHYPAIGVTQLSAKVYCEWLSAKTGHYYRLPTEAEWEYACRAGTTTAYSFGNDTKKIDDYAWHEDNSDFEYHPVGKKKPNPWGLHDMHGNVNEWCLDKHDADFYQKFAKAKVKPLLNVPNIDEMYGRVVRGGGWDQSPDKLRSASRWVSEEDWKQEDPQLPQSVWYLTDADSIGFRLVRPLKVPSKEMRKKLMLGPLKAEIDSIPKNKKRKAGSLLSKKEKKRRK